MNVTRPMTSSNATSPLASTSPPASPELHPGWMLALSPAALCFMLGHFDLLPVVTYSPITCRIGISGDFPARMRYFGHLLNAILGASAGAAIYPAIAKHLAAPALRAVFGYATLAFFIAAMLIVGAVEFAHWITR